VRNGSAEKQKGKTISPFIGGRFSMVQGISSGKIICEMKFGWPEGKTSDFFTKS
jgi:hypothetical protein